MMPHHGSPELSQIKEMFKQQQEGTHKPEHPQGKLNENDEGAISFKIGDQDGKVVIEFPKPVVWMGMSPQEAVELAQHLIKRARGVAKEPLTFTLH